MKGPHPSPGWRGRGGKERRIRNPGPPRPLPPPSALHCSLLALRPHQLPLGGDGALSRNQEAARARQCPLAGLHLDARWPAPLWTEAAEALGRGWGWRGGVQRRKEQSARGFRAAPRNSQAVPCSPAPLPSLLTAPASRAQPSAPRAPASGAPSPTPTRRAGGKGREKQGEPGARSREGKGTGHGLSGPAPQAPHRRPTRAGHGDLRKESGVLFPEKVLARVWLQQRASASTVGALLPSLCGAGASGPPLDEGPVPEGLSPAPALRSPRPPLAADSPAFLAASLTHLAPRARSQLCTEGASRMEGDSGEPLV